GLACTIRPEQCDDLTVVDDEVDAEQHGDVAVARLEGVDAQQLRPAHDTRCFSAAWPRYAAMTRSFARTCAGVPMVITDPKSIAAIRSHTRMTNAMSWSTRTMVTPRRWRTMGRRAPSSAVSCASRPDAGSSSNNS